MEKKLNILSSFFENPNKRFGIRELSRILKINHTSVRQYLLVLEKEGFIELVYEGNFSFYKLIVSRKMLNLKLYYNLEKIRESGLIEDLEKFYDFPVIILFGSYASARDDILSDLDLCLISNVEKVFSFEKYEKIIRRKVELHKFTKSSWSKAKKLNPHLVNSICNGLVLSGELEVL